MLRAADQLLLMSASHDADSGLDEENDVWQCGRVVTAQTANDGKDKCGPPLYHLVEHFIFAIEGNMPTSL